MKTKRAPKWQTCPEPKDADQWITPPSYQGQIVHVSYAIGGSENDIIYCRRWNQNDGTRTYTKRFLRDDEEFEPWNVEPE